MQPTQHGTVVLGRNAYCDCMMEQSFYQSESNLKLPHILKEQTEY